MGGIFGNMFDMNRDGKMDAFERAMELNFLQSLEDEAMGDDNDDMETELELAGIDPVDLEYMTEDERREVLEEAGLDADDFDF